jgi:hypothetical protein
MSLIHPCAANPIWRKLPTASAFFLMSLKNSPVQTGRSCDLTCLVEACDEMAGVEETQSGMCGNATSSQFNTAPDMDFC